MNNEKGSRCHRSAIRGPPMKGTNKTLAWGARRRNRGKDH